MQLKHILRWGAGCGIEVRGSDLRVVAVKSRPGSFKVLGRIEIADIRSRPPAEWGSEYATLLKDLKLSHLAATVSLPRSEIVVRQLSLPPLNRKELGAAVGYQLETLHPYETDQVYTAFAPLGETAEGVTRVPVAVLIAQKTIVDGYADLFESAGVAVASFTREPPLSIPACECAGTRHLSPSWLRISSEAGSRYTGRGRTGLYSVAPLSRSHQRES